MRTDHTVPSDVDALAARIARDAGGLDGRRPHWGNYMNRHIDDAWGKLVETTTRALAASHPRLQLTSDRKALTLRAGEAAREVLPPELFFTKAEAVAAELCERAAAIRNP